MVIAKILFSSESGEHTTPKDLFDRCNRRWGPFDLDAAATKKNALARHYCSLEEPQNMDDANIGNSLLSAWFGRVWCNPPYGRNIGDWVKHAWEDVIEFGFAQRVVMLLPARTDTRWWQNYVKKASEVHFLKGRLKFSGAKNSAPFPSAIVVFERPFE